MFEAERISMHDEQQEAYLQTRWKMKLWTLCALFWRLIDTFDDLFHKLLTEYAYITYSHSSIHIIFWDQSDMKTVSAHWVPWQLTETNFNQHHAAMSY